MEQAIPVSITTAEHSLVNSELERRRYLRRRIFNTFMTGLVTSLTIMSVGVLALIVILIFINGIHKINIDLFVKAGPDGGIGHAIVGTLEMLLFAAIIAVPVGVATAVFLSEYGRGWFAEAVRWTLDLLAQLPSIIVGLCVWALLINNGIVKRSGIAGSIALAIIMLPIVARSVEEILRLVPDHLREAALALGTPRWRVTLGVVIPTVFPGIVTGLILALARAAGETAPLLLTALGNSFFQYDMSKPIAAIPLQLYEDAVYSTDPDLKLRAWSAALVLIVVMAVLSATVRFVTGRIRYEA
jgi:phosphate transport system permease protein